ncbi:MAG: CRISPR-associated helicase Cas3' [Fimbriimonadaceae bacterium]
MLIRILFSTLVDADYLDTERHFKKDKGALRSRYPSLNEYRDRLDRHLEGFRGASGPINERRRAILASCRAAADSPTGFFDLQVPTGGGKTLSGLAFALDHALRNGLRRVVVAIPYTSIIDQTADVYASIFGAENILEHHSAVETEEEDENPGPAELRRRLATENWDCPLVVTTTVQLFDSLHSNRPSRCRKLHRLAKSVIVLDEVQTLPNECVGPCLNMLKELAHHYGSSVVFSTATMPDFSVIDPEVPERRTALVPDFAEHFEAMRRVRFECLPTPISHEELSEALDHRSQVLAVLNSRKDALEAARRCRRGDDLFLLSTLLCGHHRKHVIDDVRRRLVEGRPVRLVSTQVVEAGVDLDFPVVYRAIGPLDRIAQAAGRCNREGRLQEGGRCVVFRLQQGREPLGSYRTATRCAQTVIDEFGPVFDQPEIMARYFRDVFRYTETGSLDKPGDRADVLKLRSELAFAKVAEAFRIIDEKTFPAVVEQYPNADVPDILATWETSPHGWHRRIANFTVPLPHYDRDRLLKNGALRPHPSGLYVYSGPYDDTFGLADLPTNPDSLIC